MTSEPVMNLQRISATGVTRTTAKRLADVLGVDETQVIHLALYPSMVRVAATAFSALQK